MTRLSDFSDAPLGSYVCEEGWLVIGEQAWTLDEWNAYPQYRPHPRVLLPPKPWSPDARVRYHSQEERDEAKRHSNREHMRRVRMARRLSA